MNLQNENFEQPTLVEKIMLYLLHQNKKKKAFLVKPKSLIDLYHRTMTLIAYAITQHSAHPAPNNKTSQHIWNNWSVFNHSHTTITSRLIVWEYWTDCVDVQARFKSCTPGTDIHVFHLYLQILSHYVISPWTGYKSRLFNALVVLELMYVCRQVVLNFLDHDLMKIAKWCQLMPLQTWTWSKECMLLMASASSKR